jgi:hypothetical protein
MADVENTQSPRSLKNRKAVLALCSQCFLKTEISKKDPNFQLHRRTFFMELYNSLCLKCVKVELVVALNNHHTIYGLDIVSPPTGGVEIAIPKKRDRLFRFATFATFGWDELEHIPPVDCVIHLAGKSHDTKNTTKEKAYFDINVGLTQKIFEYF